jgi:hypothetical protein
MKMNILFILTVMLCSVSCEKLVDHGYYLKVQNNTNDTVWCYSSYNYPDTTLAEIRPLLQMIIPESHTRLESKEKWEDVLPRDTIIVFIFSKDTVDTYSWEKIRSEYNILKRYDLSVSDLENHNWTITYP